MLTTSFVLSTNLHQYAIGKSFGNGTRIDLKTDSKRLTAFSAGA